MRDIRLRLMGDVEVSGQVRQVPGPGTGGHDRLGHLRKGGVADA
jgi:hypothetical protein